MFDEWQSIAMLGLGLVQFVFGLLVRLGYWRVGWVENYRDREVWLHWRNGAFASLPAGAGWLSLFISIGLFELGRNWHGMGEALLSVGIALMLSAVVVVLRPPQWLKPAWLREEERQRPYYSGVTRDEIREAVPWLGLGAVAGVIVVILSFLS